MITRLRDVLPPRPLRGQWRYEDQTCGRCGTWAEWLVDGGERLCYRCVALVDGPPLSCDSCDRPGAVAFVHVGGVGVCVECAGVARSEPARVAAP